MRLILVMCCKNKFEYFFLWSGAKTASFTYTNPVLVGGCDAAFLCPKPEAKGLRMGFLPNGGFPRDPDGRFCKVAQTAGTMCSEW